MERVALQQWMDEQGFSTNQLAGELAVSYDTVYKILTDIRPMTNNFKWAFVERFGWQEAAKVFTTPIPAQSQLSQPITQA